MIEPYKRVFTEIAPLLESLRFTKESESSFGSVYVRSDDYRMSISIERTGDGFSVDLEKVGAGARGHLWPDALMEALDPAKVVKAAEALRDGFQEDAVLNWWEIFLTFLVDNAGVVFRFPTTMEDPSWSAYVQVYNRKLRELDLRSCSEIQ